MKLIVGLGNPGPKHETTRHNVGFLLLDEIAHRYNIDWSGVKFDGVVGKGRIEQEDCYLLKPQTFMNLSGRCIVAFMNYFKIAPAELIVIYDELDLPPGQVKSRAGGGHGGHNGVRNIIELAGTKDFHRIKVGIGKPSSREDGSGADWVLKPLPDSELVALQEEVLEQVLTRLTAIFSQMNSA